ncbi:MAG TPA: CHASE3 domain-containing protein, partial [Chthoniobacterales bacterium]
VFFFVSRELSTDQKHSLMAVQHTHLERAQVNNLYRLLSLAESAQRGYLLAREERYLVPFRFARIQVLFSMPYLQRLTRDNPSLWQRSVHVQTLMHDVFTEMQQGIDLVRTGNPAAALRLLTREDGPRQMQVLAGELQAMNDEEGQQLQERRIAAEEKLFIRENISIVLLFLSAGVAAGAGVLLLRIQQLQSIITICAWTQRVNYNGRWMRMEEFLWERFRVKVSHGISEEAFTGVMGILGKNLTVSDHRDQRPTEIADAEGRQTTRWS